MRTKANGLVSNMNFSPHVSLVAGAAAAAAVALPAVAAVPGRAVVRHVGYRGSDAHGPLVHGHGPPLVPVPAVHVAEVAALGVRLWRRLSTADRLEALGVAVEGGVVPVGSRPGLLRLRLAVKTVASAKTGKWCQTRQRCWTRLRRPAEVVPVVRVGLSGVEAGKAVGMAVVVWALVHAGVAVGLDLLVAIPVGVVSSPGTRAAGRQTERQLDWWVDVGQFNKKFWVI